MNGIIYDIKRFAIHDGPGIRTTVFLKGCNCSCWWCHNPESISKEIVTVEKTIKLDDKTFKRSEKIGRCISDNELVEEILKDRVFFEESDGGVTFSGGEPMVQKDFLYAVLKQCKKHNIHTTVDTCALFSPKEIQRLTPLVDLFLIDFKLLNKEKHKKYIGTDNDIILSNIKTLLRSDKKVWIRIPVIPMVNIDETDEMIDFLIKNGKPQQVNLLPYHKIGNHKYERFNMLNRMSGIEEPSDEQMNILLKKFRNNGFKTIIGG